jgi:DNA-binding protein YbaB
MTEPSATTPGAADAALGELNRIAAQAQERLAHAAQLRDRLADLVGRGQGADGLVRVVCTPTDPVHEVHVDPRAMRMVSTDLAEAVRAAAHEARRDLDEQTRAITRELVDRDDDPLGVVSDPAAARVKLAELDALAQGAAGQAAALFERLGAQLRR